MKYINKSLKIVFLLVFSTSFFSCLSVEADIVVNPNGSGIAKLSSTISTLASDFSEASDEVFSLPLNKSEWDRSLKSIKGIEQISFEDRDDGSLYYINSHISFDTFTALSEFTGIQFTKSKVGNNHLLQVLLYEGSSDLENMDKILQILKDHFSSDRILLKLEFPNEIVRVSGAKFSGKIVSFDISLLDMLRSSNSIEFSVEYR